MSKQFKSPRKIFDIDPDLRVREEFCSIHAINPFVTETSSARSYMASSHISQDLTILHGEERIIQTGVEKQFGANTFSKKVEEDSRAIAVIPRYRGLTADSVREQTQLLLITQNLETNEYDCIDVPHFFSLHQYFGFPYIKNKEVLDRLTSGTFLPKGTILADSPTVSENSGYKFGINANVALVSLPETAEDGVVISESTAKKLSYKVFETRVVEFGEKSFPLNIYGDDKEYKAFKEIGEYLGDDSVVMVTRDYDPLLSPALTSVYDTQTFDPRFDNAIYARGPGEQLDAGDYTVSNGLIVDIKVYHNPKFKKDIYTGTTDGIQKYINGLKQYYTDILKIYEEIKEEHYKWNKNYDVPISPRFHRLIVEAFAIVNPQNHKIAYTYRADPIDIYRMEFTIEYTIIPGKGSKITDLYGSKGVITSVIPDEHMITCEDGSRADIVMDPSSIVSRMNVGRLYEQYFNASSRKAKKLITAAIPNRANYTDKEAMDAFKILLEYVSIVNETQYKAYASVKDMKDIRTIIDECLDKEVHILYTVSAEKKPYDVVLDMEETKFAADVGNVMVYHNGVWKKTKNKILIGPLYIILLSNTADHFLSSASPKTNHYGLPIGVGNAGKYSQPWKNSPTKTLSETEVRLFIAYGGRISMAELKDRANAIDTHIHIYKTLLEHDTPSNIDKIVDRNLIPYGGDVSISLIDTLFNTSGMDIEYIPDPHILHKKQ